jgi:hypothetical protein
MMDESAKDLPDSGFDSVQPDSSQSVPDAALTFPLQNSPQTTLPTALPRIPEYHGIALTVADAILSVTKDTPQEQTQYAASQPVWSLIPKSSAEAINQQESLPKRQKTRGPFTEEHAAKITEVRRLGACLRCRISKKPVSVAVGLEVAITNFLSKCDEGMPCQNCQYTGNERPKSRDIPCTRSRLPGRLTVYASGRISLPFKVYPTNSF